MVLCGLLIDFILIVSSERNEAVSLGYDNPQGRRFLLWIGSRPMRFSLAIAPGKVEARLDLPEATHRYLKAHAGARGMREFIHDNCRAYQKQTALDDKLRRLERYMLEL